MTVMAGLEIRDERRRRRWSVAELAGRAGMSDAHVAQIEAGEPASLESYARLFTALDREPQLHAFDKRQRPQAHRQDADFVHAAMAEVEARRLASFGFSLAIDEPYQHYQFAGRADLLAWDLRARAMLHIENRTEFPNIQESLGSYATKRAYLGRVIADRLGLRDGWLTETHVIAALWTSDVLHVLRLRTATFGAACADGIEPIEAWWSGAPPTSPGSTSSLVLLDPAPTVRPAFRIAAVGPSTRPRHRGYAEAAERLRSG
jgi:transcriptional regulator with XRE-family HTH domain